MMKGKGTFLYNQRNYWLILIAVGLIITGYLLMTGSGNAGDSGFNQDIYSMKRITVAPLVLFAGYALMILAIIWNPKARNNHGESHSGKI